MVGEVALHGGEGYAVVRGANDEGIVGQTIVSQSGEDAAHFGVEGAGCVYVLGHVTTRLRSIGKGHGWSHVARIGGILALGLGRKTASLAVGLAKAHVQIEGRLMIFGQEGGGPVFGLGSGSLLGQQAGEAAVVDVRYHVLEASHGRGVTGLLQSMG